MSQAKLPLKIIFSTLNYLDTYFKWVFYIIYESKMSI